MNAWPGVLWRVTVLCLAGAAAAAERPATTVSAHGAWARATPPGIAMGAVYLVLKGGPQADRLIAAATPRAASTQIHVVSSSAGMTQMRETAGVDVPAAHTVALAPQGTHLMLIDLVRPLSAGERFPLTLKFASAGSLDISVEVVAPAAAPAPAPAPSH